MQDISTYFFVAVYGELLRETLTIFLFEKAEERSLKGVDESTGEDLPENRPGSISFILRYGKHGLFVGDTFVSFGAQIRKYFSIL